jgi:peptide/nickel transport system permease protein
VARHPLVPKIGGARGIHGRDAIPRGRIPCPVALSGSYPIFVARRLAAAVLIAVIVGAITFVMLRVLRPESFDDPRPLATQTLDFLWGAFTQLDLGRSRQPPFRPVSELVRDGLPADLSLFLGALVVGAGAGIAGGVFCSRRPGSVRARALRMLALLALCAPVYWVALVSLLLFGSGVGVIAQLGIFDTGNYEPLTRDPIAWLQSLVVPWAIAGAPLAAICLRMTDATMRDLGDEDFVRTARGKGLSERRVAYGHALPAAVSPTLAVTGAYVPLLVGNALLVEQVFNIPGVFRETTGAISNGDFPLLQGLVIVGAFLVVVGNLAADLVLGRLDPRVRMQ